MRVQSRRRAGRLGGVDGIIGVARIGDDGGARRGIAARGGGGSERGARREVGVVAVRVVALAVVVVVLVVAVSTIVAMSGEAEGLVPVEVGGGRIHGHAVGVPIVAAILRGEFNGDPRRMRGSGLQRQVAQAPLIGIISRQRDHGAIVRREVDDAAGGGAAFRAASPAADALVVVDDAQRARVQEGFPFAGTATALDLHEGVAFTPPFAVYFADHGCWEDGCQGLLGWYVLEM